MMKHLVYYILTVVFMLGMLSGCIEDGVTASPSSQPVFSVDTLKLGTLFTGEGSPTYSFKIFNRNNKALNISRLAMRDDPDGLFRLNVDGMAGREFGDVEIRAKDSIFVFVEVTLPDMGMNRPLPYERHLDVAVNGVTSTLVMTATGVDATRLNKHVFKADASLDAERPYIVYDTMVVSEGVTLTLEAGTKLHFHDGAALRVDGTLLANGTPGANIEMTGDRWGNVVGRVDYEIMSGQWEGVYFTPSSRGNRMEYTSVRNTMWGVIVDSVPYDDGVPSLYMLNCQLRNSKDYALLSSFSSIEALGCELADAASGVVALQGGTARIVNCTIANYYLFSVLGGAALQLYHVMPDEPAEGVELPLLEATVDNCIIYGNGAVLSHGDLAGSAVTMRRCLLGCEGSDDDNFVECLWNVDPLYGTVREDYHFDYRLQPESPAIGSADGTLMPAVLSVDRFGVERRPGDNLGAYAGTVE